MSKHTGASLLSIAEQLRREAVTPATTVDEGQEHAPKNGQTRISFFNFDLPEQPRYSSPPPKNPKRLSRYRGKHSSNAPTSVLPRPLKIPVKVFDLEVPTTPSSPSNRSHSSASSSGSITPQRSDSPQLPPTMHAFPLRGGVTHTPPTSPQQRASDTSIWSPSLPPHSTLLSRRPSSASLSVTSTMPSISSARRTLRRRFSPPKSGPNLREIRKKESEACLKRLYDKQVNAYLDGSIALSMFGLRLDDLTEGVEEESD